MTETAAAAGSCKQVQLTSEHCVLFGISEQVCAFFNTLELLIMSPRGVRHK
ncbi:hypothetical protein E2C01_074554 [Portunus trituberculatus]|uniref:Uncharacterized protein n=1 Tax=Portunus trituberculatus TaxID=210409 RepID=A0A5B7ICJ8_PORTR|nr:hypothetical protein [Portunus trituberculatus]